MLHELLHVHAIDVDTLSISLHLFLFGLRNKFPKIHIDKFEFLFYF